MDLLLGHLWRRVRSRSGSLTPQGDCEGTITQEEKCNDFDCPLTIYPCAREIALTVDIEDSNDDSLNTYSGKYVLNAPELEDSTTFLQGPSEDSLINGYGWWKSVSGDNAIWWKNEWRVGPIDNLGTTECDLMATAVFTGVCPHNVHDIQTGSYLEIQDYWRYKNSTGHWQQPATTEMYVSQGKKRYYNI